MHASFLFVGCGWVLKLYDDDDRDDLFSSGFRLNFFTYISFTESIFWSIRLHIFCSWCDRVVLAVSMESQERISSCCSGSSCWSGFVDWSSSYVVQSVNRYIEWYVAFFFFVCMFVHVRGSYVLYFSCLYWYIGSIVNVRKKKTRFKSRSSSEFPCRCCCWFSCCISKYCSSILILAYASFPPTELWISSPFVIRTRNHACGQ